jgi:hypothetical protein
VEGAAGAGRAAGIAGEVADVARGAEAATVASEAARGAEVATVAGEAARGAEVGEAAKLVSEVDDAAKVASEVDDAAKVASEVDDAAKVASEVDEAAQAANTTSSSLSSITDAEIDELLGGLDNGTASSGSYFELPGQNPRTSEGLRKMVIKADETKDIAYHQNMTFKGIDGAPGGKVEVRYHSANPNAPAGSYSQLNPTTQINSVNPKQYMLPDGTFKPLSAMTELEKDLAHFR